MRVVQKMSIGRIGDLDRLFTFNHIGDIKLLDVGILPKPHPDNFNLTSYDLEVYLEVDTEPLVPGDTFKFSFILLQSMNVIPNGMSFLKLIHVNPLTLFVYHSITRNHDIY